jgi:quercetin dioxygenase-like cupin family protein
MLLTRLELCQPTRAEQPTLGFTVWASGCTINGTKGLLRLLCFEPNQSVPLHRHPKADEYFFVIKGKGKVTIGSEETDVESSCIIRALQACLTNGTMGLKGWCCFPS